MDASFEFHPDFKSHIRAIMTMGKGSMQSVPRKHKLNMSISQEAGLVAVGYTSVYILWKVLFIKWQGYKVDNNILYKDNNSAILREDNDERSAGNRNWSLNIHYVFT